MLENNFLQVFQFQDERPEDEQIRKQYGIRQERGTGAADPAAMTADLHATCIQDFIRAVRTHTPYPAEGEAALRPIRLIERIVKSKGLHKIRHKRIFGKKSHALFNT